MRQGVAQGVAVNLDLSAVKWARRRKVDLAELVNEPWSLPPLDSLIGTLVADAFRARGMKFPPVGAACGAASFLCAYLPRGPFLGTMPASLLRFGAIIPQGATGDFADSALAGWNHVVEEPCADARGAAFH